MRRIARKFKGVWNGLFKYLLHISGEEEEIKEEIKFVMRMVSDLQNVVAESWVFNFLTSGSSLIVKLYFVLGLIMVINN